MSSQNFFSDDILPSQKALIVVVDIYTPEKCTLVWTWSDFLQYSGRVVGD